MRNVALSFVLLIFSGITASAQQQPQTAKFVTDTLVVGADGQYETDPDLATLTFEVTAQEKTLKDAYLKASDSTRKILDVAEKNGIDKDSIETGALSLTPLFDGKRRARSYLVQRQIVLKLRDFSKIGPIMDDSVQEGIIDFRSLTYSLSNEENAKQKAVAEAMRRAVGRASIALEQSKQKLGPVRYVNLDVTKFVSVEPMRMMSSLEVVSVEAGDGAMRPPAQVPAPPPTPMVKPQKITIRATVQCVFQIL